MHLEGYHQNGITYRFPKSIPYFRMDVSEGRGWDTPLGHVQLTHKNLRTVSATGAVYEGCYRYVMSQASGESLVWVLKPGLGFVRIGEGPAAFTLRRFEITPASDVKSVSQATDCPLVALSSIPRGEGVTSATRRSAFESARAAHVSSLKVEASWEELEPSPGVYDFERILDEIQLAEEAGMPAALTIKSIDTVLLSIPADLKTQPLNHPETIRRYVKMLDEIAGRLPRAVRWINLGYEVDFYLALNPDAITPFRELFLAGAQAVRAQRDVSVGIVFQFDNARISDVIFRQLSELGDHVAINYYGHTEGFFVRDPSAPLVDIPLAVFSSRGKPLLITELGYPTSPVVNGSEENQALFLRNAFAAISLNAGRIPFVNVWSIRDLPGLFVQRLVERYGVINAEFIAFLSSLGLQNEHGDAKPAWDVFVETAREFRTAGTCVSTN
jgi:hypothetical protein